MTKRYKNTFREKVLAKIRTMPENVILRRDVASLGHPRQVSRALKALVEDGDLVKLGFGVYVKARKSEFGEYSLIEGGFTKACVDVLNRLGVKWEAGKLIKDYNEGRSQQVPAMYIFRLKSRFRRKLAYRKRTMKVEGMVYAK